MISKKHFQKLVKNQINTEECFDLSFKIMKEKHICLNKWTHIKKHFKKIFRYYRIYC